MRNRIEASLSRSLSQHLVHQPVLLPFLYQTRSISKFLERQSQVGDTESAPLVKTAADQHQSSQKTDETEAPGLKSGQTKKAKDEKAEGSITSDERAIFDRLFNEVALKTGGVGPGVTHLPSYRTTGYLPFEQIKPVDVDQLDRPSRTAEEIEKAEKLLKSYPTPLRRNAALANGLYDVYERMAGLSSRSAQASNGGSIFTPRNINRLRDPSRLGSHSRGFHTSSRARDDAVITKKQTPRRTKGSRKVRKAKDSIARKHTSKPVELPTQAEIESTYAEKVLLLDDAACYSRDALFEALKRHIYPLVPISGREKPSPLALVLFPRLIVYAQTLMFRCYRLQSSAFILPKLRNFAAPDPITREPKTTGALHYVLASSQEMYDLILRAAGGVLDLQTRKEEQSAFASRYSEQRRILREAMFEDAEVQKYDALDVSPTLPPDLPQAPVWKLFSQLLKDIDNDSIAPIAASSSSSQDPSISGVSFEPPNNSLLVPFFPSTATSPVPQPPIDLLTTIDEVLLHATNIALNLTTTTTTTTTTTPPSNPPLTSPSKLLDLRFSTALINRHTPPRDRRHFRDVHRWRERVGRITGRDAITDLVGLPGRGRRVDLGKVMGLKNGDGQRGAQNGRVKTVGERETAGVRVSAMAPAVPVMGEGLRNYEIVEERGGEGEVETEVGVDEEEVEERVAGVMA